MQEAPRSNGILRFDHFSLDTARGCLLVDGVEVPLRPKTFALLSYLAANPGRLVSKDELIRAVWRGALVSDDVLVQSVGELRRALGGKGAAIIRTVPRRGYRFEADVSVAAAGSAPAAAADSPVPDGAEATIPDSTAQPEPRSRPALRRWPRYAAALVLLAAVLSLTAWKVYFDRTVSGAPGLGAHLTQRKPVVAVSRFANAEVDPASAIDLREKLIDALSRFSSLSVSDVDALPSDALASEREAPYQIDATMQRLDGRVVVSARVVDRKTPQRWTADFVGDEEQLGEFAAEVEAFIARSEQAIAVAKPPDALDAYDYVQRGRYALRVGNPLLSGDALGQFRAGVIAAREAAESAIARDPYYAPAWSLLAEARALKLAGGFAAEIMPEQLTQTWEAVNQALNLDKSDVRAHALRAYLYLQMGDERSAEEEVERLRKINPNDPVVRAASGRILVCLGRTDEAIKVLEFIRRNPSRLGELGGWERYYLALAYYLKGRYQDAVDTLGMKVVPDPEAAPTQQEIMAAPLVLAAASHAQLERMADARVAAQLAHDTDTMLDSRIQQYGAELVNRADLKHLRQGLIKAGLLAPP